MDTPTNQPSAQPNTETRTKTNTKLRVQMTALTLAGLIMGLIAVRMWIWVSFNGQRDPNDFVIFRDLSEVECFFLPFKNNDC